MRCLSRFAFTFLLLQNVFAQDSGDSDDEPSLESELNDIANAFSTAGIVPDLIPSFRPAALLNVHYTMAGEEFVLNPGETVPSALTENEPKFALTLNDTSSRPTGSYVVILLDPEGPTAENSTEPSQILHYLKHDLSMSPDLLSGNTQPLARYQRIAPYGEEPHQYVVLIYPQPESFGERAPEIISSDMDRSTFNLTGFAREVNLTSPVAGNYFLVLPDENAKPPTSSSTSSVATRPSLTGHIPSLTPLAGAASQNPVRLGAVAGFSVVAVMFMSL